jgi:aryl-alcohol dehydrogenase-like predicted oxidoreductase
MRSINQLIFGTAALSAIPTQGRAMRLLEEAYSCGIRHFDTAPLYGQGYAEWVLGRFLSRKGEKVQLSGKFGLAGGVLPRLDPRLAMPLNYLRKKYLFPRSVSTSSPSSADPIPMPYRRITREQLEASFKGSLERLGRQRFDYYMIHEGLPSFLDDDARSWLLRQQSNGRIGMLGVAARGSALQTLTTEDLRGFDILQYEAGSIFDDLVSRHPDKRHFLHSCFTQKLVMKSPMLSSEVLPYWADRNPDGKLIFFTRRINVLRENIAPFQTNLSSEGHAIS